MLHQAIFHTTCLATKLRYICPVAARVSIKADWNTDERGTGEATKADILRIEFKAAFLSVIPFSYFVDSDCLGLCASRANLCKQVTSCFHGWTTSKYLNGPDLETRFRFRYLTIINILYSSKYYKFSFYIFLISINCVPKLVWDFPRLCGLDTLIKFIIIIITKLNHAPLCMHV